MTQQFYVGQKLKNSPQDDYPYFEIINITTLETTGTVFYRVASLHDSEMQIVLLECDLFPFEETTPEVKNDSNEFETFYKDKLVIGGHTRIVRAVENLLLRPNDTASMFGQTKVDTMQKVIEEILASNDYPELNHYYSKFNRSIHGFSDFERWNKHFA